MDHPKEDTLLKHPTRREFTRTIALLVATPVVGVASEGRAADGKTEGADPLLEDAEALTEFVRSRYAKNLSPVHLTKVREMILGNRYLADLLKPVKLRNSDPPAFSYGVDLPPLQDLPEPRTK